MLYCQGDITFGCRHSHRSEPHLTGHLVADGPDMLGFAWPLPRR